MLYNRLSVVSLEVAVTRRVEHDAQRLSASLESSRSRAVWRTCRCGSAQRLSASLESSLCVASGVGCGAGGCSTPFGIIGVFTSLRVPKRGLSACVLNAFRHHWSLHESGRAYTRVTQ